MGRDIRDVTRFFNAYNIEKVSRQIVPYRFVLFDAEAIVEDNTVKCGQYSMKFKHSDLWIKGGH